MNLLASPMPFRLDILEQSVVSNSDQVSQRSDGNGGLPQDHLDITAGKIVHLIRRIKQALDYVGHSLLLTWVASVALRFSACSLLIATSFAGFISFAFWLRFDAPIWGAF